MAEPQETIADIIAEMRDLGKLDEKSTDKIPRTLMGLGLRTYADRLDAARKREIDVLKQRCAELNAEVAAKDEVIKRLNDAISEEQRRKMATTENPSAVGDCAKLRKAALRQKELLQTIYSRGSVDRRELCVGMGLIDAALAAPPRNCDIYLTEEAVDAATVTVRGCEACSRIDMEAPCVFCMVRWLLAPAQEKDGGAKWANR